MLRLTLLATTCALLTATASAQCATLTATGTGAPGTSLVFSVDGTAANAFAFLVVGSSVGTLPVDLGPISFTLGVVPSFLLPLGTTNAAGDVSLTVNVPNAPVPGADFFAQSLTLSLSLPIPGGGGGPGGPGGGGPPTIGFSTCTSNVVGFHYGS